MTDRDPVHRGEAERWGGWRWAEPRHGEHFRRCSYCGCVHPEDLAAEQHWTAQWADRKYNYPHKFYVDIPNHDPDALFCIGASSQPDPEMVPADQLTDRQREIVERDGMGRPGEWATAYWFGTRSHHFGKFYTAHLADPQIAEEVRLVIFRRGGLRFTFDGGRVAWEPAHTT
jgi:hypothetical protein